MYGHNVPVLKWSSDFSYKVRGYESVKSINYDFFPLRVMVFNQQILPSYPQGLGASEKKKKNYIILQGGELTCFHFFKSSC